MKRHLLLPMLLAASPLAAQTPADTFRLERITVTATKSPAPIDAIPASVTVLSGDALRARGHLRVIDALADVAGVSVAQLGGIGAVASLFLRGGESDYVQVLVDGVQVNDPGGAFDWAHLATADVDRIEVVRGPASVLYGSDAVAGVVQIFTRRGTASPRVSAEVTGSSGARVGESASGRYGTWSGSAGVAGSRRGVSFSFNASRQHSDGAYAFNNDYANTTISSRIALGQALSVTARYVDQQFNYPTDGAGNVVDHNRYTFGESLALGVALAQPLGSRLTVHAAAGLYRNDTGGEDPEDDAGQGFSRSSAQVERDHAELRVDAHALPQITVSVGGEVERQRGRSTFDSDGPFGPYSSATDDERANRAAFAQLVHAGSRLGVTAGARIDHSDQFGSFGTARAGASYRVLSAARMHVTVGTGFKEPTFLETYATGFARGNPALEPEQSRSAEVGVQTSLRGVQLGATAFAQRFRNLIQYSPAAPENAPSYYNVGKAEARGVEVEAAGSVVRALDLRGTYTYVDTEVLDEGFGQDMQFEQGSALLRRPRHTLAAGADWRAATWLTASVETRRIGERADLDFTDPAAWQGKRITMPAHTTVDAALTLMPRVRFGQFQTTVRVQNLLDERYAQVYNFPAPGRVLSVTLRATR